MATAVACWCCSVSVDDGDVRGRLYDCVLASRLDALLPEDEAFDDLKQAGSDRTALPAARRR